jgi:acetyl esterase/lipase
VTSSPQVSRRSALLSVLSGTLLVACSPAGLLNGLSRVAGDSARLAASGVPFGDDPRLKLDVWAPRQRSATPLPVVVFFYGGGWVAGERGDYGFVGRAFAALGFVTIIPDYRLVPQVLFPTFIEDCARAVKWAHDHVAEFGGDPRRIALSGHSAGAYNAAMVALDHHFLADIGVDPAIIRAAALLSGPYDFYPFTEERGRAALGRWPRPMETQPIHFVRRDAPPMLLMHGAADTVVEPRNSREMAAALTKAGAVAELKLYPGKSHIDTIKSLSPLFRGTTSALADSVAFFAAHDGIGLKQAALPPT